MRPSVSGQCRLARHHQQPPRAECMEPRAAIAEYNEPEEHFTLYTTSQNPQSPPRAFGVLQHRAGASAGGGPDVAAASVQRFHLSREMVARGPPRRSAVRCNGPAIARTFLTARMAAITLPSEMAFDKGQQGHRLRVKNLRQSRRLHVAVLLLGADLSLCELMSGQSTSPTSSPK